MASPGTLWGPDEAGATEAPLVNSSAEAIGNEQEAEPAESAPVVNAPAAEPVQPATEPVPVALEFGGGEKVDFPMPASHKGDWIRYHGTQVDLNMNMAAQQGRACYACHDRADCIECHGTYTPRDHNGFWRTRGHGLSASGNRELCQVCHRQDYCVRCHQETTPSTHRGNWDSDRHCQWCHFEGGLTPADSCSVCHKRATHTSAPHAVNPAVDCSTCH